MNAHGDSGPSVATEPQLVDLIKTAGKGVYWLVWPIAIVLYWLLYYLAFGLLTLLTLLWRPIAFTLLPFVYLGHFLFLCLQAPFKFLARFETLYIYLGSGAIVGCCLGLLLAFIYSQLQGPLGLNTKPDLPPRTAKEYRQERRKRQAKEQAPLLSPSQLTASHSSLSDSSRKSGRGKPIFSRPLAQAADSD